ncbi:M23 family metallopeptidase [Leptolyngbya sp. NIES-2104]|uniref:M23 family metallopeptidase n=1 Tax=Leptolyngbya sp. NIES-2104 TaxID=1552121 RepID=UPI0006EC4939|nr:M23 family metallopeptidase [Leptolyngbya sp. NIES-2104]GAP98345.1 peptidase M23B [Leptolyngbya sp. NIES-2104]
MLELIPSLFAQQQLKQPAVPVQSIEQSATQTPTSVVTPTSAIATPESVFVSIPATPTPAPVPTPSTVTPITSKLSLPQVPQKPVPVTPQTVTTPQPVESSVVTESKPVTNSIKKPVTVNRTTPVKLTERSRPVPSVTPTKKPAVQTVPKIEAAGIEIPVPKPATQAAPKTPTTAIEIPVPKPPIQAAPTTPSQAQKQLLEQRLADIVSRDREAKQAQQRDTLVARAYSLATQRRFAQARKLLQDPSISAEMRDQILSNINSLESASRTVGVTPIKEPVKKPARPTVAARKPSTKVARAPQTSPRQQAITIQVPRAIQSLPIQRRSPIPNSTSPIASDDSTGQYIDQLVTPPKNLQAFNRNLPQTTAKGQIVYPLPEPVPVTSGFGWRRHPVTGVRRFHAGVDLGAAQGTPVIASRGGKVTVADRMGGYGLAIVMQQPNGKQDTLYAHLSQIYVRPGEKIQPGMIIGRVGSTGLSTGPHLHYEARQMTNSGWTAVNPGAQIEAARARLVQARQQEERSTSTGQGG